MRREHIYDATAEARGRSHLKTLKTLSSYLWPQGMPGLKLRVILALTSLAAAKGVNVYIPFLYKGAVDALSAGSAAITLPIGLIIAYGGAKVLTQFFGEFRDFIFVRVATNAQRSVADQSPSAVDHAHRSPGDLCVRSERVQQRPRPDQSGSALAKV